jgi:uncharacterized protein
MKHLRTLLAACILLCMTLASAWAQDFVAVPPLQARVTDLAGMLKPDERKRLESVLKEHEDRSGNQVAVLLVPSTAPESIEQYSIRVTDAWKLGRKGVDDGVLLLVARDNPPSLQRLRIEAGRGVQGSLTDAQSKRILQDVIAPHFRQNDYYGGLVAGIAAIHAAVDKENLPAPQPGQQQVDTGDVFEWLPMLLFGFVILTMLFGRRRRRSAFTSNNWGRSAGVILGSGLGWGTGNDLRGRGGWGGGFGGGGGGFSGGGGGFDGGGASGNW